MALSGNKETIDYAEQIKKNGTDMLNILNNISEISLNRYSLKNTLDLQLFLQNLCSDFQYQAESKKVNLICKPHEYSINSNDILLSRILRNLIDNALKFAKTKIILGNDHNHIWIIDDGCGISPQQQSAIFQCFYKGSSACGWGMGLAIVADTAKQLGIKISLKSQKGRYTAFRLTFPS